MRAIRLKSTDPIVNLAFEEHLFRSMRADSEPYLLLWQNAPSVIVGRHQNTQAEVDNDYIQAHAIPVVRRITGGGAVYHDLGNLNFSFLSPRQRPAAQQLVSATLDFHFFLQPIIRTLALLGVQAELSSRNDLTVKGAKISGSAQFRNSHALLHHGTLLFALDMDMLSHVLRGDPDKYQSKGLASVRSRVINLRDVLPPEIGLEHLADTLVHECGAVCTEPTQADIAAAQFLAEEKYQQWNWNYGASPFFTEQRKQHFPWGRVECCYTVRAGCIENCRIYGDFFATEDITLLEQALTGLPRESGLLASALHTLQLERFFSGCDTEEIARFLSAL